MGAGSEATHALVPSRERRHSLARLRQRFLGIPPRQVARWRADVEGTDPGFRARAETIADAFLFGYAEALAAEDPVRLAARLDQTPIESRGFAYEGAGMGLAARDAFGRGGRLVAFADGPGAPHVYVVYVGAGWMAARLPILGWRGLRGADSLERWFAYDGFGFHEAYFRRAATLVRRRYPRRLPAAAHGGFDEGVGRCLWFLHRGEPEEIGAAAAGFPGRRRADVWSGVGLACGYAGAGGPGVVAGLLAAAPELRPALAQGVAFAAEAWCRAGHATAELEETCRQVAGRGAVELARLTVETRPERRDGQVPAFEVWQRRMRERLA